MYYPYDSLMKADLVCKPEEANANSVQEVTFFSLIHSIIQYLCKAHNITKEDTVIFTVFVSLL